MDFQRLRTGEIVAGVAGVALLLFLFFDWFGGGVEISAGGTEDVPGLGEVPTPPKVEQTGVSGWDALTDFDGFLITLSAIAGITLAGLAAAGKRIRLGGLPRGEVTAFLGSLASLLILWRIFAQPVPGADLKIGIFLGLIAAVGIAVGALMALREDGFEPVIDKPGGRTRSAASSAASSSSKSRSSASTTTKRSTARKPAAKSRAKSSTSKSRSSSSRSRKS
jgi:hypothetical protein